MVTALLVLLFLATTLLVGGPLEALARRRTSTVGPSESLFVSFALGVLALCFVPTMTTGLIGLFFMFEMSFAFSLSVTIATAVPLAFLARRRWGRWPWAWIRQQQDWGLFGFLLFVFGAFMLAYDAHLLVQQTCALRIGILPFHNYLTPETRMLFVPPNMVETNAFLIWPSGIRLGAAFVISPFVAWFEMAGLRVMHAVFGVLIAGFAYLTAARLLKRRWTAYLAATAAALNPALLAIGHEDENVQALAFAAGAFYFLLASAYRGWAAGLMLGFALGPRHTLVLCMPSMFFYYWIKDQWKEMGLAMLGTLVTASPWIMVHISYFLLSGSLQFESFGYRPEMNYELLGFEFPLRAILSWPFTDELVRSPYNGFPTLLSYPLLVVQTFGLLFAGACLAGLTRGGRLTPLTRIVGVLWFLPFMMMLMVQASWEEPNKMGLFLVVSSPVALLGAAGLGGAVGQGRRVLRLNRFSVRYSPGGLIRLAVGVVLLLVFVLQARSRQFPVDERTLGITFSREESPAESMPFEPPRLVRSEAAHSNVERKALEELHFFPAFRIAFPLPRASLLWYRTKQVLGDLRHPGFNERHTSFKDVENLVVAIRVREGALDDLREGPADRPGPARGPSPDREHLPMEHRDGLFGRAFSDNAPPPGEEMDQWGLGDEQYIDRDFIQLLEDVRERKLDAIPISYLVDNPFDQIFGAPDYFSDSTAPPEAGVTLELALSEPPVANPRFVKAATGPGVPVPIGQVAIIRDIEAEWVDGGQIHAMAMASKEGAVHIALFPGHIAFDHVKEKAFVDITDWTPDTPVAFLVPPGQPLYVYQLTHFQSRSYHAWIGLIGDDDVELSAPFRTSY